MVRLRSVASLLLFAGACGGGASAVGAPDAGGTTGGTNVGGSGGTNVAGAGGRGGIGGTGGSGGDGGSDGTGGGPASLADVVDHGAATIATAPRPDFGAVIVAADGARLYAVESRRDVEPGPLGIPWRSRFRLAAYDGANLAWAFAAPPDDMVSDVAIHPSGDVTVAVLHYAPAKLAYDLVRLDRGGAVLGTTTMAEPQTTPASDFGPTDPRPLFRMKSDYPDATVGGWVRLLPAGDDLIVTFLSYVDAPDSDPLSLR